MVASRMQSAFCGWPDQSRCRRALAVWKSRNLHSGRIFRSQKTFELLCCSGVRESELHSGAHGAAQRADAEGRQSL